MSKNQKALYSVIAVIVVAASFYGGTLYGKSQVPVFPQNGSGNFAGMGFSRTGVPGNASGGMRNGSAAGFVAGQIVSKSDTNISVELRDGGSRVVFFSPSTEIQKMGAATSSDLTKGTSVVINGSVNADGSVTAQSIQIRPEGSLRGAPEASSSAQ